MLKGTGTSAKRPKSMRAPTDVTMNPVAYIVGSKMVSKSVLVC